MNHGQQQVTPANEPEAQSNGSLRHVRAVDPITSEYDTIGSWVCARLVDFATGQDRELELDSSSSV